ncbi:Uncharacterized protein OBRU01_12094 [Operophtera brumata]|uniref:Uncharacterized protein n=1 Tax=Operophtera brumata TaxID=104452 RepID=A0A0L7L757_OPEBR|nr:Uncharacterized protein OBRU01_12094 [Operophtera brumata]
MGRAFRLPIGTPCAYSIWNACPRPIYIHCCGLWDETARLGASWCCYPRTRFHLAPGMASRLAITATPRIQSPVPLACAGLQLAASHMRDHVVGYFVVPIVVKFLNCIPYSGEEE